MNAIPTPEERSRRTAVALMKMALALLDSAQEGLPACHLQHAIDALTGHKAMLPGDELDLALVAQHL